jgi:hypothetical protein
VILNGSGLLVHPVKKGYNTNKMREAHILRRAKTAEAQELKQKALEPQERHCYIQKKKVNILVEYLDYKDSHDKGPEGAIYCEHILECYQANIRCRYSGISPLFDDPFVPRSDDEEEKDEEPDSDESNAEESLNE